MRAKNHPELRLYSSETDLVMAIKRSIDPMIIELEAKLVSQDGQILDLRVSVDGGKIKMEYCVSNIDPSKGAGT